MIKKLVIIVEKENNEILVRFTASMNASRIQSILDYLRYKELTSKSKAKEKYVDELVKESKSDRWEKIRKSIGFDD
ncbi:hypothetical protein [Psychroflexus maritimus]|uniref:Uncharacterized protein n=1 Tax=Psychroflexus maritimus TaxID=2714865 RepID=A0A967ADE4_9FLAO|nr:hypothetical protein [Psychroflexus maritimus]NGZ90197.1 hypothetical protein [Psychroflexus maritimus]